MFTNFLEAEFQCNLPLNCRLALVSKNSNWEAHLNASEREAPNAGIRCCRVLKDMTMNYVASKDRKKEEKEEERVPSMFDCLWFQSFNGKALSTHHQSCFTRSFFTT